MLFMKKLNTKIFSFVLALLMIFGVSSTAFAAEIDNPNNNVLGTYEIEVPICYLSKLTISNLQVCELVNGSWISGLLASKNITIN